MGKKTLQLQQLNNKMLRFASLKEEVVPSTGWIKAIRTSLGMSMQQLGNKLNISKQGVLDIERREKDGSISIKSLREVALVMDMKLVYGFIPLDGTLDALIEKKAKELAKQIEEQQPSKTKCQKSYGIRFGLHSRSNAFGRGGKRRFAHSNNWNAKRVG
jgi:predicted DNA-binding mobile mystery protein A